MSYAHPAKRYDLPQDCSNWSKLRKFSETTLLEQFIDFQKIPANLQKNTIEYPSLSCYQVLFEIQHLLTSEKSDLRLTHTVRCFLEMPDNFDTTPSC